jgi:hypothetical protein
MTSSIYTTLNELEGFFGKDQFSGLPLQGKIDQRNETH